MEYTEKKIVIDLSNITAYDNISFEFKKDNVVLIETETEFIIRANTIDPLKLAKVRNQLNEFLKDFGL